MDDSASYLSTELPRMLDVLLGSDVVELEVEEDGTRLRIHRSGNAPRPEIAPEQIDLDAEPAPEPPIYEITSPLVGTFYRANAPDMEPYVSEGSHVQQGTVVGIVEALQVLTEVESAYSGVVTDVRLSDGQPVEYGQVLFEVRGG